MDASESTLPLSIPDQPGLASETPAPTAPDAPGDQDTFILQWRAESVPLADGSSIFKIIGSDFVDTDVVFFCRGEHAARALHKLVDDLGVTHTLIRHITRD